MLNEDLLAQTKPIDHDNSVDDSIKECLQTASGKSFITFAGAGSGKTYSLKETLSYLKKKHEADFSRQGKQIAVVTFTNNAADEITDRVERNPIFAISTIHSFCWLTIKGFNEDIRKWYLSEIPSELTDLEDKERRGRAGAASDARKKRIVRLTQKIEWLDEPRTFVYDPNGVNSDRNSLSHADVLKVFAYFLNTKPMMAEVLVNKYPFIFVDESQDADKGVINALFAFQQKQAEKIVVGLFGDTMQRIFGGGEPQLGKTLPVKWEEFDKQMNHRSARRIVELGNKIRLEDDGRIQFAKEGSDAGFVRYFLLPHGTANKDEVENNIRSTMAEVTGDQDWLNTEDEETAILLLEHKMVGRRLGFDRLWEALSKPTRIADRVSAGENSELNYFSNIVLPLAEASLQDDEFEVMTILRTNKSPLLEEDIFSTNVNDPLLPARMAEKAFQEVVSDNGVTFLQVLKTIAENNLLPIPEKLKAFVISSEEADQVSELEVEVDSQDELETESANDPQEFEVDEIDAWAEALETPFFQVRNYRDYISENSIYRTHQGVKGNEFERVMVIMDDDEAGGFMFSYEQYFGAKDPSKNTIEKIKSGEETGLDRTRRLFYVTSTRAKSSLAHAIYTSNIEKVRKNLIDRNFAKDSEIIEIQP